MIPFLESVFDGAWNEAGCQDLPFVNCGKLTPSAQETPSAQDSATNHWPEVEVMCETLLKHAPDDHFAIRHQAEAFHKQGRSREAFSAYQYAPAEFKHGADYFYALARYLCALDQERLASTCISNAIDWDPSLKMKALNDPELEKVWLNLMDD